MKAKISSTELKKQLKTIQETLRTVDFEELDNVIFFDSHSFYKHLARIHVRTGNTLDEVLSQIEDCIPFAITDDSFSLFLSAGSEDEAKKMEALRQGFVESCKTDFLLLALQLCDSPDWENMEAACEDLRQKNRFQTTAN